MAFDHVSRMTKMSCMWLLLLLYITTSLPCITAETSTPDPLQEDSRKPPFIVKSRNYSSTTPRPFKRPDSYHMYMLLNLTAPSCEQMQGSDSSSSHCYHDRVCVLYNDCCYETIESIISGAITNSSVEGRITGILNSVRNNFVDQAISTVRHSSCVTDTKGRNGYLIVTQCKTPGHVLQAKCSAYQVYRHDNIPVDMVDKDGNLITFANIYCAQCHGITVKQVQFWTIALQCPPGAIVREDMALSQIATICTISLKSSYNTRIPPRYCTPSSLCTGDRTDRNDLLALCEAYSHTVVYDLGLSSTTYQNPHCAACSIEALSVQNLTCYEDLRYEDQDDDSQLANKKLVDLHVLFDFNSEDGVVTQIICYGHKPCADNEIFDCNSKRCRSVICPNGQRYYKGECIKTTHEQPRFDIQMPLDNGTSIGKDTLMIKIKIDIGDINGLDDVGQFFELLNLFVKTTPNSTFRIGNVSSPLISNEHQILVKVGDSMPIFSYVQLAFEAMEDLEKAYKPIFRYFEITVQNYENVSLLYCKDDLLVVDRDPQLKNGNVAMSEYKVNTSIETGKWKARLTDDDISLQTFITCLHEVTYPDMGCLMFSYKLNEVTFDNKIMYVINTSLSFLPEEYRLHENRVFVCANSVEKWTNIFEYSIHFRLLSIITSSFSLIALSLIVLAHVIIPPLRNIHGLNLTALSITMLLIHALLLSQVSIGDSTLCIIYAVVLHWLLLMMFMWMNIIGFDMAMLFKSKVTLSQRDALPRFKKYLLISVIIPSTLIGTSVGLNYTDFNVRPGYGERQYCWISNALALFVFFWSPIVIALLVNAGLFAFTVYTIQGARRSTRYVKNNKSGSHNAYFFVYLKMTVILGLTWLIAFLGPIVRVEAVWIMHIILNGLQGVSLLICFVLNSRVIRHARNRGSQSTGRTKRTSKHDPKTQDTSLNKL